MTEGADEPRTVDLVTSSLTAETADRFEARVADQADWLRTAIAEGRMDNADFAVGLEMEVYAVDRSAEAAAGADDTPDEDSDADAVPRLARLPDGVFDADAANKELGRHNVEINTDPTVLDEAGLAAQATAIRERTEQARAAARAHDRDLVLDAMWTVPPAEGAAPYLSAVEERDGLVFAENMRQDPRYVAIDNDCLRRVDEGAIPLSVPGVDRTFPSILFESLATSIQPHLQIPSAAAFPAYYNAAIRTLGPLLAIAANSPFLPADLYGDVDDPAALVEATHHELRIAAFEQSVNHTPSPKVRVPRDIEDAEDIVDRVVADDRYAPFLREWLADGDRETLAERVWEFDHKRGTYWRWLRCVVGGDPVEGDNDESSLRIEYRPLPTQPSVTDVVGLQALTAGLLRGLVAADHPIADLPWSAAEASFYSAVEDGLDAELAWLTADGERTSDPATIYDEIFAHARRGLDEAGVPADDVDRYLAPIEARWGARTTPSAWKKARVREALDDGADFAPAVAEMQRAYVRRSLETDSFAAWL
jgi:hypothetical protein